MHSQLEDPPSLLSFSPLTVHPATVLDLLKQQQILQYHKALSLSTLFSHNTIISHHNNRARSTTISYHPDPGPLNLYLYIAIPH
jgi:hypothetical protein